MCKRKCKGKLRSLFLVMVIKMLYLIVVNVKIMLIECKKCFFEVDN